MRSECAPDALQMRSNPDMIYSGLLQCSGIEQNQQKNEIIPYFLISITQEGIY
jgi:hypothetical protein